jgi:quinol monooxygenase YgiN
MLVVHVNIKIKPECIDAFKESTIANARESRKEPGIARFDLVQQIDDPTRFVLVEAYRTVEATAAHKATAHYATWRDRMESLMAEPRSSVKYSSVSPEDESW